jgi:hypothetical protein
LRFATAPLDTPDGVEYVDELQCVDAEGATSGE